MLFALTMSRSGSPDEGVAALLSFDCYLRIGELTRLQHCDVVMPNDPRVGAAHTSMALRLADTKTGLNQWVSIQHSAVTSVFLHYLHSRAFAPADRVFAFTPARFRGHIRRVCVALGLGSIPYVPHSFRHGGATCDYLRGVTVEQIMFRGRWRSMESARRYIQTGRALLTTLDVAQHHNDAGATLASHLHPLMVHLIDLHHLVGALADPRRPRRRVTFAVSPVPSSTLTPSPSTTHPPSNHRSPPHPSRLAESHSEGWLGAHRTLTE